MIIIGHSNAGKSPLGQTIQQHGLPTAPRCHHFDFGRHLREIAAGKSRMRLPLHDVEYIRSVLNGTLFDDAHFSLALSIIVQFVRTRLFDCKTDTLVFNGFPRHRGQAQGITAAGFRVASVVWLDCPVNEAYHRKLDAENGVGHENRSDRNDNINAIFHKKILSFEQQTRPVLTYYRKMEIPIIRLPVSRATTPDQMYRQLVRELQ